MMVASPRLNISIPGVGEVIWSVVVFTPRCAISSTVTCINNIFEGTKLCDFVCKLVYNVIFDI